MTDTQPATRQHRRPRAESKTATLIVRITPTMQREIDERVAPGQVGEWIRLMVQREINETGDDYD